MTNFELLNNIAHKDLKVITEYSAEYGDDVMYSMTFPFEFRNIQSCYPILFHKDTNSGDLHPVALFGFQDKENLFLDEDGWNAPYVPAMIRRQPFLIGFQDIKTDQGIDRQRVVSLDRNSPRVNTKEGEALFEPLGGRTEYLEQAANLLESIHEGLTHSKAFVQALREHDLLESVTMDITLNDGSNNQLLGFYTLNEERVQELTGDVLATFSKNGYLQPLFMVIASLSNVGELVRRKNGQFTAER